MVFPPFYDRPEFIRTGGEELRLSPSLNSNPAWVEVVSKWIHELDRAKK